MKSPRIAQKRSFDTQRGDKHWRIVPDTGQHGRLVLALIWPEECENLSMENKMLPVFFMNRHTLRPFDVLLLLSDWMDFFLFMPSRKKKKSSPCLFDRGFFCRHRASKSVIHLQ